MNLKQLKEQSKRFPGKRIKLFPTFNHTNFGFGFLAVWYLLYFFLNHEGGKHWIQFGSGIFILLLVFFRLFMSYRDSKKQKQRIVGIIQSLRGNHSPRFETLHELSGNQMFYALCYDEYVETRFIYNIETNELVPSSSLNLSTKEHQLLSEIALPFIENYHNEHFQEWIQPKKAQEIQIESSVPKKEFTGRKIHV